MLTLLEEIVLLTINPRTGCLEGGNNFGARYALAGAVLFDLALADRIDTDIDTVFVINDTPTGNVIQDDRSRPWRRVRLPAKFAIAGADFLPMAGPGGRGWCC